MNEYQKKIKIFEEIFPYVLLNNEWKYKIPMKIFGKETTYNPDYFCPDLKCFIELTTSNHNIKTQRRKWIECVRLGVELKIFTWDLIDLTDEIMDWGKEGGRPRNKKK